MMQNADATSGNSGQQTGTDNKTYNLTSVLYHALQGVENCEAYGKDAKDGNVLQFFDQACQYQKQIADQAKQLLHDTLMSELQGQGQDGQQQGNRSAFGSEPSGETPMRANYATDAMA